MADAMDSKSISRKGVGVQVPASAPIPVRSPPDELSRALVAVLLHKLANTTQYLSAVNACLADEAARSSGALSSGALSVDGLSSTALEVDELGFVLGLVANANGADLLLERRKRNGLTALVSLVVECVRRAGGDIAPGERTLPELAVSSREDAWRTPWAVGRWLFAAGVSRRGAERVEWELSVDAERPMLVCHAPQDPTIEACALELAALDPRFEFELGPRTCLLRFASGTFAREEGP